MRASLVIALVALLGCVPAVAANASSKVETQSCLEDALFVGKAGSFPSPMAPLMAQLTSAEKSGAYGRVWGLIAAYDTPLGTGESQSSPGAPPFPSTTLIPCNQAFASVSVEVLSEQRDLARFGDMLFAFPPKAKATTTQWQAVFVQALGADKTALKIDYALASSPYYNKAEFAGGERRTSLDIVNLTKTEKRFLTASQ